MKYILISLLFTFSLISFSQNTIKCVLKGTVIDRPQSTTLYLAPNKTDFRVSEFIKIPIQDGKFEYTLECEYEELYELIFEEEHYDGRMVPIFFIAEEGEVIFELYSIDEAHNKNIVDGSGMLNKKHSSYKKERTDFLSPLYKQYDLLPNRGLTDAAFDLYKQLEEATGREADSLYYELRKLEWEGMDVIEESKALSEKIDKVYNKMAKDEFTLVKNDTTVFGLILFDDLFSSTRFTDLQETNVIEVFQKSYQRKFEKHPIVQRLKLAIAGKEVKVGAKFRDFSLPDFDGKQHTLSNEIEGKIALLDLWASWCGPCRRNSMSMMPTYDKYKDKGFVVIGVAREENKDNALKAIEQDGYQWLNLLELRDSQKVWAKYGIGNAGGACFLIDSEGVILAIDPSVEELEEILDKNL